MQIASISCEFLLSFMEFVGQLKSSKDARLGRLISSALLLKDSGE